jgi:hypothetical protein
MNSVIILYPVYCCISRHIQEPDIYRKDKRKTFLANSLEADLALKRFKSRHPGST